MIPAPRKSFPAPPSPSRPPAPFRARGLGLALRLGLALWFGLASGLALADPPAPPPEPPGLWTGAMRGATPETLTGARTIDVADLARLLAGKDPVLLIDVGPADRKPPSMAADAPWLPAHRTIPGAVWMPGAGLGSDDPAFSEAFRQRVEALAGGDHERPIVVFCQPNCWGSWNAGKRLVGLGYTRIHWLPGGVDAWQAEYRAAIVKADPVWALAAPQAQPQ